MNPTAVIESAWRLYSAHWKPLRHVIAADRLHRGGGRSAALLSTHRLVCSAALLELAIIVRDRRPSWLWGALVTAVDDVRDGQVDLSIEDTFRCSRSKAGSSRCDRSSPGIILGLIIVHRLGLLLVVLPGCHRDDLALRRHSRQRCSRSVDFGTAFSRSIDLVQGPRVAGVLPADRDCCSSYLLVVSALVLGLVLRSASVVPLWLGTRPAALDHRQ